MIVEAEFKLIEYQNKFYSWFLGVIIAGIFFFFAIIDLLTLELDSYFGILLFCIPFPICLLCSFVYYILYRIQYKVFKILKF